MYDAMVNAATVLLKTFNTKDNVFVVMLQIRILVEHCTEVKTIFLLN